MATLTSGDILGIIKGGNYPYPLQFFRRKQKYVIYPSIEIVKTQPDSKATQDAVKYTITSAWEVRLYIKYTRPLGIEEDDRADIENEIVRVLEEADLEPEGKIFFESLRWSKSPLDQEIFGSISTLSLEIHDIVPIVDGIIGAYDILELNSETPTPTRVQVLGYTVSSEGVSVESHQDDQLLTYYDPSIKRELEFTITYLSTNTMDGIVNTASKGREEVKGKLVRGTVTQKYNFLIGNTTKLGQYADVEKSTTQFYVTGTWSVSKDNVYEEVVIPETTIAKLTKQT